MEQTFFLKLRLLGSVNQAVQKFKRVLGWVTILSTILFLGRAVTTLSDWFLKDQSVDFVIGEKVFFLTLFEICPVVILLVAFGIWKPQKLTSTALRYEPAWNYYTETVA